MRPIEGNFNHINIFDYSVVERLSDFFDIDFVKQDQTEFKLWFENLKLIAEQNLGLAHSIVHNQTARNKINLMYHDTKLEIFNRPYKLNIGSYSFYKGFSLYKPDTIVLQGTKIKGTKYWASHLDQADYIVLEAIDQARIVRVVFLNLKDVAHSIVKESAPIGMKIAAPADIVVDDEIPPEWVCNQNLSMNRKVSDFHYYGLTANYISCAKSLIKQAQEQKFQVDYNLKKLILNTDTATLLWEKSFVDLFESAARPPAFKSIQYQFAKKNLIDVIGFFLEIMNTGMCDQESLLSQTFRDAVTFSSHNLNLYKQLNTNA